MTINITYNYQQIFKFRAKAELSQPSDDDYFGSRIHTVAFGFYTVRFAAVIATIEVSVVEIPFHSADFDFLEMLFHYFLFLFRAVSRQYHFRGN